MHAMNSRDELFTNKSCNRFYRW